MSDLRAETITVRFGGLTALSEASIEVPAGEIVGLIGPNGAGKTTLFDVISGFTAPTRGRVSFGGRDITRASPTRRARMRIGRTFQKLELFGRLSVNDNLLVAAETGARLGLATDLLQLPGRHREERRAGERVDAILDLLDLRWARERRAADLPVGTARIVELGRALCTDPVVLLLDEPSSGLDSSETTAFGELLRRINEERGVGILLVEHDMDLVLDVSRHVTVLDFGRVIAGGTPDEIVRDPAVRTAYLGEEADAAAAARS
jgi:ABC-type branched-subunit amino acid transport system ATPase component